MFSSCKLTTLDSIHGYTCDVIIDTLYTMEVDLKFLSIEFHHLLFPTIYICSGMLISKKVYIQNHARLGVNNTQQSCTFPYSMKKAMIAITGSFIVWPVALMWL